MAMCWEFTFFVFTTVYLNFVEMAKRMGSYNN